MSRLAPVDISGGGKLVLNVMHFARALRAAGGRRRTTNVW